MESKVSSGRVWEVPPQGTVAIYQDGAMFLCVEPFDMAAFLAASDVERRDFLDDRDPRRLEGLPAAD